MTEPVVTEAMCKERYGHIIRRLDDTHKEMTRLNATASLALAAAVTRIESQISDGTTIVTSELTVLHDKIFIDNGGDSFQTALTKHEGRLDQQDRKWGSFMKVFWLVVSPLVAATVAAIVGLLVTSGCINSNVAVSVWRSGAATGGAVENASGAGGVEATGLPK